MPEAVWIDVACGTAQLSRPHSVDESAGTRRSELWDTEHQNGGHGVETEAQ